MVFDDLHHVNEVMYQAFSKHEKIEMSPMKQYIAIFATIVVMVSSLFTLWALASKETQEYEEQKREPILSLHAQNNCFQKNNDDGKDH